MKSTGYLYHKQKPAPRQRRAAAKTPLPVPSSGIKNEPKNMLVSHIRTFVLVFVGMVALVMLAMYVSRKTWDNRHRKASTRPSSQVEKTPTRSLPSIPTPIKTPAEPAPEKAEPSVSRPDLDTDAMRKAINFSNEAEALASAGEPGKAIERYREALSVWPYLTLGWAKLGHLYLDTRQFTKAQIALERAVENEPGSPEILNELAVSHFHQNHLEKAVELLNTVQDIDPTYAPSYFNLTLCHLALNRKDKAAQSLDQYLTLRPGDPKALKEKAYLQAMNGDYEQALATLQDALRENPNWPPLYLDAAATSALLGNPEQAIAFLEEAEKLTSPVTVYKVMKQPAFKEIRESEAGKQFERRLAEQTRTRLKGPHQNTESITDTPLEPLTAETPSLKH